MSKIKLFMHPAGIAHIQDAVPGLQGTTPFCREGIEKHCQLVQDWRNCDLIWMGQVSEWHNPAVTSPNNLLAKCVIDVEGDWWRNTLDESLKPCLKSGNLGGIRNAIDPFCVRPPMSNLLVHMARNGNVLPEKCSDRAFAFRGLPDECGIRARVAEALKVSGREHEVHFTNKFGAQEDLQDDHVLQYLELMRKHTFAICPRGKGEDSIRPYEACFLGRVVVIVGEAKLIGSDYYDTDFAIRINSGLTESEMAAEFAKIGMMPQSEIEWRSRESWNYANAVVREYFRDPTQFFVDYLHRHGLVKF